MFSLRSFLYISSIIISSFDLLPVVLGGNNEGSTSMENTNDSEALQTIDINHFVPAGVGNISITEDEFTNRMKTLFSDDDKELLCDVTLSEKLTTIPNITCKGAFSEGLEDSLRKLKTNYTDEDAQNKVLDLVWKSKVGEKMLALLSKEIFSNESNTKARVKEMWFMYEGATFVRLFPDVFLGFELEGDEENDGKDNGKKEEEGNEEEEEDNDDEESDDFPYDAAPVSWTGNYFRQSEGDLKFQTGNTTPLVEGSLYLASIQVELGGDSRKSTFVVGTTFIYDFISYSMCWIYGVTLERCIVPLPGTTTEKIVITNITSSSYLIRHDNITRDLYSTCIGFKVTLNE